MLWTPRLTFHVRAGAVAGLKQGQNIWPVVFCVACPHKVATGLQSPCTYLVIVCCCFADRLHPNVQNALHLLVVEEEVECPHCRLLTCSAIQDRRCDARKVMHSAENMMSVIPGGRLVQVNVAVSQRCLHCYQLSALGTVGQSQVCVTLPSIEQLLHFVQP